MRLTVSKLIAFQSFAHSRVGMISTSSLIFAHHVGAFAFQDADDFKGMFLTRMILPSGLLVWNKLLTTVCPSTQTLLPLHIAIGEEAPARTFQLRTVGLNDSSTPNICLVSICCCRRWPVRSWRRRVWLPAPMRISRSSALASIGLSDGSGCARRCASARCLG